MCCAALHLQHLEGLCGGIIMQVGTLLFTVVVLTVHLELATVLEHWTWLHYFAIVFSIGARPISVMSVKPRQYIGKLNMQNHMQSKHSLKILLRSLSIDSQIW